MTPGMQFITKVIRLKKWQAKLLFGFPDFFGLKLIICEIQQAGLEDPLFGC